MSIHIIINGARKVERERDSGKKEWWIMHPSNDSILAYCDSEEEADKVISSFNEVSSALSGQR